MIPIPAIQQSRFHAMADGELGVEPRPTASTTLERACRRVGPSSSA